MDGKMDAEALACLASCLQHGWLRLYDVKGPPTYQLSCGKSPYRDNVVWQQRYCVLSDTKLMLLDKDEVHPSLLQERRSESCSVSMLRRTVSVPSKAGRTASGPTDDDPDAILDRVPRREGAPTLVTMKSNTIDGCTPPPFTVTGFISKRLKRTKSQSKLDRSITLRSRLPILGLSNSPAPSLKESHSHESLLGHGRAEALELSQGVRVRPLHCSILGQEHCFEIMAPGTIKCFSCRSAAERDRWLDSFSRALHPNRDNMCREEISLRLWLIEARHLPPKKRFFCEVCVDDMLLARTAARLRPEGPFWGERFHFTSLGLSSMVNITIHVYRSSGRGTGDGAKRRRKKERSSGGSGAYVGLVNIPANTVEGRHLVEQWYPLSAPTPGRGKAPTPTVRVRTLLRRARVLPLERYKAFAEHVTGEYGPLCNALEAALSARDKEEVAGCLVRTLHSTGRAKEFLTQVVMAEVERCGDDQLIFRENTLATKAIEEYLKLVGQRYLQDALGDFIKALYESEEQCEVDPSKVPASQLSENQTNLKMCCELAFCKIINSFCVFPRELKEVFSAWRLHCAECGRPEVTERLIGSSLFLRFLCPAVMAPSLFGLTHEYPGEGTARTLTLIAKVIQNLANFSRFGSKELYMAFMNEFLESETSSMHSLLADVSSTGGSGAGPEFDGRVDLGLELALLHDTLFDVLPTLGKAGLAQLGPLPQLVNDLMADLASPPPLNQQLRHLSGRFSSTPNVSGSISSGLQSIIEDEEKPTAKRTTCTSRTGEQQQVHHEPSPKVSAPSPSLDGQPQHERPVHWSTGKSQSLLDLQPAEGTRTPALCFQNPLYDVPQNAHAERLSEWSPMSSGAGREDETKHHTYCGSEDQGRHGGLSLAFAAHRLPMVAQQAKLKSLTIGMARVEEPLEASLLEPNTHVQGARWREMSSPLPGLARFSSGSSQEDESPSPAPRSTSLRQKPLPPEGTGSEAALSPSERTAAWLLAVPCGGIPRTPADTPPPLPPRPLVDNGPLEQLSELRNVLHAEQCAREEVEQRLAAREESERRLLVEYRARLTDAEERLRRAQIDKDAQMKGIVARLIAVEEERKREQAEMQQIIETQKQRITSLEENNGHLLNAVTQLQEHCARQTRNGLPSTSQSLSPKLTITENGEFTHSTC